jgi:hypothetical protein
MQGRRTFILIDEWLTRYVPNAYVRLALMVGALIAVNVLVIAAAGGLVELLVWALS